MPEICRVRAHVIIKIDSSSRHKRMKKVHMIYIANDRVQSELPESTMKKFIEMQMCAVEDHPDWVFFKSIKIFTDGSIEIIQDNDQVTIWTPQY